MNSETLHPLSGGPILDNHFLSLLVLSWIFTSFPILKSHVLSCLLFFIFFPFKVLICTFMSYPGWPGHVLSCHIHC